VPFTLRTARLDVDRDGNPMSGKAPAAILKVEDSQSPRVDYQGAGVSVV
jgi:hypothetical protein